MGELDWGRGSTPGNAGSIIWYSDPIMPGSTLFFRRLRIAPYACGVLQGQGQFLHCVYLWDSRLFEAVQARHDTGGRGFVDSIRQRNL